MINPTKRKAVITPFVIKIDSTEVKNITIYQFLKEEGLLRKI